MLKIEGITKKKDLVMETFRDGPIHNLAKLPIIVLYEKPIDYPEHYVARLFNVNKPTKVIVIKDSLQELRKTIPVHMLKINRSTLDESQIIESYI